jgi:protein subunit release factor A
MRTTVTVTDDDLVAHVDARDASTDAGRVRRCIKRSQELDECRERVSELEETVERLEREKRLILEERDEHTQLVRAVEQEQSLAEERAQAGLATRVKWWLFGRDEGE